MNRRTDLPDPAMHDPSSRKAPLPLSCIILTAHLAQNGRRQRSADLGGLHVEGEQKPTCRSADELDCRLPVHFVNASIGVVIYFFVGWKDIYICMLPSVGEFTRFGLGRGVM
jgi:hypothetical protein